MYQVISCWFKSYVTVTLEFIIEIKFHCQTIRQYLTWMGYRNEANRLLMYGNFIPFVSAFYNIFNAATHGISLAT